MQVYGITILINWSPASSHAFSICCSQGVGLLQVDLRCQANATIDNLLLQVVTLVNLKLWQSADVIVDLICIRTEFLNKRPLNFGRF